MIPIRTDTPIRRTPVANIALIAANVLIYVLWHVSPAWRALEAHHLVLRADDPAVTQFLSYPFLHDHRGPMHLIGNMIFLWVFGNAVNAKMGHLPYVLFYLAGGVFAGAGFAWLSEQSLVGASGAIAAVTTAYLALFPRSRITFLYWFFLIGFIELPSLLIITFKIVLWDNVIAPNWFRGQGGVAYSAHLSGYAFGFAVACLMLWLRALPRDQFDIVALLKRWNQRRAFAEVMRSPEADAQARYGRVAARPAPVDTVEAQLAAAALDRITELRVRIGQALAAGDRATAAMLYEELVTVDPHQVLSAQQMLDVGNQLYLTRRHPQAAACYERFLQHYPRSAEAEHVRLLLGIIYARDLQHYEAAERHLRESMNRLTDSRRREQCGHWLDIVLAALGRPRPGPA